MRESPVDGKRSTLLLNRSVIVLLWHSEWTQNKEYNKNYLYKLFNNLKSSPWVCLRFLLTIIRKAAITRLWRAKYVRTRWSQSAHEMLCTHVHTPHLVVNFWITCHMHSNMYTPFPALRYFLAKKKNAAADRVTHVHERPSNSRRQKNDAQQVSYWRPTILKSYYDLFSFRSVNVERIHIFCCIRGESWNNFVDNVLRKAQNLFVPAIRQPGFMKPWIWRIYEY